MLSFTKLGRSHAAPLLKPSRISAIAIPRRNVQIGSGGGSGQTPLQRVRRFYKQASYIRRQEEGVPFVVQLDGKSIKTPAGKPLAVPTEPLAIAIAMEWQSQTHFVRPFTMPLTQICSTAIDRVSSLEIRQKMIEDLCAWALTDVVAYRVPSPQSLRERQDSLLQPVLDHCKDVYGLKWIPTETLTPMTDEKEIKAGLENVLYAKDGWTLMGIHELTTGSRSVALGLATASGLLTAQEACNLARIEENWQAEVYGHVSVTQSGVGAGHDLDVADTQCRILAAATYLQMISTAPESEP